MAVQEVISELMATRRNLTVALANLANTSSQLDLAAATIQSLNATLHDTTSANFTFEVGVYSGYAAVGLTGAARLAWLHWRGKDVFPLDR